MRSIIATKTNICIAARSVAARQLADFHRSAGLVDRIAGEKRSCRRQALRQGSGNQESGVRDQDEKRDID
jgi:hypothetical protein